MLRSWQPTVRVRVAVRVTPCVHATPRDDGRHSGPQAVQSVGDSVASVGEDVRTAARELELHLRVRGEAPRSGLAPLRVPLRRRRQTAARAPFPPLHRWIEAATASDSVYVYARRRAVYPRASRPITLLPPQMVLLVMMLVPFSLASHVLGLCFLLFPLTTLPMLFYYVRPRHGQHDNGIVIV